MDAKVTIISGGQTGADRTALEVARELGLATGGTAPHDWQTDEGRDPSLADFGLKESEFHGYRVRTRMNVRDAQVTVWFGAIDTPGGHATKRACGDYEKPLVLNPTTEELVSWCSRWMPRVINVAGNRRRTNPAVVAQVRQVLTPALQRYVAFLTHPKPLDSTPPEEITEKEEAISAVDENADPAWKEFALASIYAVAREQDILISEDIWRHMRTQVNPPDTHEHRALGPIMRRAATQGWIGKVDAHRNAEQMAHNRPMQQWKSLCRNSPILTVAEVVSLTRKAKAGRPRKGRKKPGSRSSVRPSDTPKP